MRGEGVVGQRADYHPVIGFVGQLFNVEGPILSAREMFTFWRRNELSSPLTRGGGLESNELDDYKGADYCQSTPVVFP